MPPPCDPATMTCLDAGLLLQTSLTLGATGVCGAGEIGPVCYGDPAAMDLYAASGTALLDNSQPQGMLPLFRPLEPSCDAGSLLPPAGVDLALSDHAAEFPAEIMAYVGLLSRLETEFGVPVSFRIVQSRLSTGETVPQIVFFRSGDTPDLPRFRGGGGGGPRPGGGEPPMPTTTGLTVSLLGGSAAIVVLDRVLLDSLIEHDMVPEEARTPLLFTTVMTAHLALHRAGLVSTTPTQGLAHAPTFMGFQILSSLLLEQLGVDPSTPGGQFLSLSLASMPFLLARQSPMLAEALSEAAAARLTVGELSTLSAEVATLRVGALFARALGYLGLIDLGARAGTWGIGHIVSALSAGDYDDNMRLWNLIRMSQDIVNQEDCGAVLAGAFGMLMTTADVINSIDPDYAARYGARVDGARDSLVGGSDEFGTAMHRSLYAIIARNARPAADGGRATIDWDGVRRDLREFYQSEDNSENIGAGYDLVDDATAPMTTSGIDVLIETVDSDGEITSLDDFVSHFRLRLLLDAFDLSQRIEARALELGLMEDVDGVRVSRIPVDPAQMEAFRATLTPDQTAFLDGEGLQWTMELMLYQSLRQALGDNE